MEYARTINFLKFLLSTALFIIFSGPVLLVILTFLVYRTVILIILKIKFGSKFGSLLGGLDGFFSTDSSSKNVINVIMIVRTPKSSQEFFRKFKETVDTKIFQNERQFSKFLSTRHKMCGYHYFIPNRVEINRCIRSFNFNCKNDEMSKKELFKEISDYSNQPLPYDNTGFWEFLFCEKPITWNNRINETEKLYAVLFRFHHSLGDGVAIMNLLLNILPVSYQEKTAKTLPTQNHVLKNLGINLRNILGLIFILLITPIVVISEIFFRHVETTSLDIPLFSNQQILVAKIEESSECLKIIKGLKLKVKDASFIDIITVAISKSFSNYFQKKGKDPNLTCLNTFFTIQMNKSSALQTEANTIRLRNTFSYFSLNIPVVYNAIVPSSYWYNFIETLEKIKIGTKQSKASHAYRVTYQIFQSVAYIFPESIVVKLVTPSYLPLIVTNIPGPSAITLYDDCFIEDFVPWIPRIQPIGLSLGFFSYDKRLQITLNVDKTIISDQDDAQDIVDGIYQALIELDSHI